MTFLAVNGFYGLRKCFQGSVTQDYRGYRNRVRAQKWALGLDTLAVAGLGAAGVLLLINVIPHTSLFAAGKIGSILPIGLLTGSVGIVLADGTVLTVRYCKTRAKRRNQDSWGESTRDRREPIVSEKKDGSDRAGASDKERKGYRNVEVEAPQTKSSDEENDFDSDQ